jgi:hypothetical protein
MTNDLQTALDFSPDDLVDNRSGKLSVRQRERLRRLRFRSMLIGAALLIFFAFVATSFLFVGQQNAAPISSLIGVGVTVANTVMLAIMARYWLRLNADLQAGRVRAVTGSAERVIRVTGRTANYVIRIGGEQFPVNKETIKAFQHEASYTLYSTPYTRLLLSGEPDWRK